MLVTHSRTEALSAVCRAGGIADVDLLSFLAPNGGRIHNTYIAQSITPQFVLQRINTQIIADPGGLVRATELGFRHTDIGNAVMPWPSTGNAVLVLDGDHWIRRAFIAGETPAIPISSNDLQAMSSAVYRLHKTISIADFHACEFNSVDPWADAAAISLQRKLSAPGSDFSKAERQCIERMESAVDYLAIPSNQTETVPISTVVHRDTKPDNFVKRSDRSMLLIDFDTLGIGDPAQDLGEMLRALLTETNGDTQKVEQSRQQMDISALINTMCAGYNDTTMTFARIRRAALHSCLWQCQRYLNDHTDGDRYYAVTFRGENLANANHQLDAFETLRCIE